MTTAVRAVQCAYPGCSNLTREPSVRGWCSNCEFDELHGTTTTATVQPWSKVCTHCQMRQPLDHFRDVVRVSGRMAGKTQTRAECRRCENQGNRRRYLGKREQR